MPALIARSKAFLTDYIDRHRHPVNATLHIFGVPLVIFAVFALVAGKPVCALTCFVLGYLFQYLGHRAQGNEVGEVILLKKIWKKLRGTGTSID